MKEGDVKQRNKKKKGKRKKITSSFIPTSKDESQFDPVVKATG